MDALQKLEDRIQKAAELIAQLKGENQTLKTSTRKLSEENTFLHAENKQVRQVLSELYRLREERKQIRQKCEKLLLTFHRLKI